MNREELIFAVRNLLRSRDGQAFARIVRSTPWQDVVEALDPHPAQDVAALLLALPADLRAELFSHLDEDRQDALLRLMPREAVVELFERMPADDRADVFNRLSVEAREQIVPALAKVEREDILKLAAYPEGTVGSVTTSDYASVAPDATVAAALATLRASAPDKETIYVVYVLDAERRLLGTVSLRELVLARPEAKVADLMKREPVYARAEWPRAQAAELIRRYDLLALPVVNGGQRMIGIVTVDDAMDIEKQADATQLARFGGTARARRAGSGRDRLAVCADVQGAGVLAGAADLLRHPDQHLRGRAGGNPVAGHRAGGVHRADRRHGRQHRQPGRDPRDPRDGARGAEAALARRLVRDPARAAGGAGPGRRDRAARGSPRLV
ncbi:MAG: CBS domain-containing protein, partial [Burkholderiaceae bacterium]|nr:CBS domain-containing protein [Burkholderiaceae bacterium]